MFIKVYDLLNSQDPQQYPYQKIYLFFIEVICSLQVLIKIVLNLENARYKLVFIC